MFCKTYTQFYAHFSVDCVFFLKLIKQVKSHCVLPFFWNKYGFNGVSRTE
jgi:hypothetical protein